jgi:peptidyl-prolyl cis-trans isomerase C
MQTLLKHGCMLCVPWLLIVALPRHAQSEPNQPLVGDGVSKAPTDEVVVATFSGGRITLADLQAAVDRKTPDVKAALARPGGREAFLARVIDYDLLTLEAERRGYRDSPAVKQAEKQAAITALLTAERAAVTIDGDSPEVAAYFAAHPHDFERPGLRRPSHIQLRDRAEAEALLKNLAGASRERFASVARQRSLDDRTRRQGGELGYCDELGYPWEGTGAQGCPPAIAKAVFALSHSDELAPEPIAHDGVFSIVMLTGVMAPKQVTLERARPKIVARLEDAARSERIDALLARLRAERPVEVHPELTDQLTLPPATPRDRPVGFPAAPPDPRAGPEKVEPEGS